MVATVGQDRIKDDRLLIFIPINVGFVKCNLWCNFSGGLRYGFVCTHDVFEIFSSNCLILRDVMLLDTLTGPGFDQSPFSSGWPYELLFLRRGN